MLNPNTRTAPLFRTETDAELTARIYNRVPVLVREGTETGNPWRISFMAMFHMANDSGLFRTAQQLAADGLVRSGTDWVTQGGITPRQAVFEMVGGRDALSLPLDGGPIPRHRYVPLYEAKMVHQFDHRWATYDGSDTRDVTSDEKGDPDFEPTPRYWLPDSEIPAPIRGRGWLMGWRDICRATDERTLIAGLVPTVATGHKFLLMLVDQSGPLCAALFGSLNSLVCDYVARQKLGGTSFSYFTMRQIAVLPPTVYSDEALSFVVPRILELTYTSHALAPFARDLGYHGRPFAWDDSRRALVRAELDAWYARAYGLTLDELHYVLDPTEIHGPDFPSETFRVLKENEIRRFGEYRTRRMILEAWDELLFSPTYRVTQ
jgi:hypothetical protein